MRKKILLTIVSVICVFFAALAATVVVTEDSCGKCSVSVKDDGEVIYKCGKCGSDECTLRFVSEGSYSATCSKCGHHMTFSQKK